MSQSNYSENISIVVLTYNSLLEATIPCLNSIVKNTPINTYELIIVDNASHDGTKEYLQAFAKDYRNVTVIYNDVNKGYSAGNNDGIRLAQGDIVVLLNNDTLVSNGWTNKIISKFNSDPTIGLLGPLTNNAGNLQRIDIKGLNEGNFEEKSVDYINSQSGHCFYTDRLGFFCVAIKRSVIKKIGLLDEAYGLGYFEDDDYCIRAMNAGFKAAVLEDLFVYHKGSVSFSKLPNDKYRHLFKKNRAYFQKKFLFNWTLDDILYSYIDKITKDLSDYNEKVKNNLPAEIERINLRMGALEHLIVQIKEDKYKLGLSAPSINNTISKQKWKVRFGNFKRHIIYGTNADRINYLFDLPNKILRYFFPNFYVLPFILVDRFGPEVISEEKPEIWITYNALNPNVAFEILIGEVKCHRVLHGRHVITGEVPIKFLKKKAYKVFIKDTVGGEIVHVGSVQII